MCVYKYGISPELRNDFKKKLNLNSSIIYSILMITLLTLLVMVIISLLLSIEKAPMALFVTLGGSMAIITSFRRRGRIVKDVLSSNHINIEDESITFLAEDNIIKEWHKKHIKIIEQTPQVIYLSYLQKDGNIDKMAIPLDESPCLPAFISFTETI